jgi:predicted GH43/DUF377 family glycosyl hydrolase
MPYATDRLIFTPDDVDLARSPLRQGLPPGSTVVLGAFNPGLAVLPGGNLLMMVRVAEALVEPMTGHLIRAIRWSAEGGYHLVDWPLAGMDVSDPRVFALPGQANRLIGLTSLSWLLPVELTPDGLAVVAVHYDRAIGPRAAWQEHGVEDPRISRIGETWYMTACCISADRQSTGLYTSANGLDWDLRGMVLDHQNKDMLLFEGLIDGAFWALTRPLGGLYFAYPPDSDYRGGPSINLARSPDALHWKPVETGGIKSAQGRSGQRKGRRRSAAGADARRLAGAVSRGRGRRRGGDLPHLLGPAGGSGPDAPPAAGGRDGGAGAQSGPDHASGVADVPGRRGVHDRAGRWRRPLDRAVRRGGPRLSRHPYSEIGIFLILPIGGGGPKGRRGSAQISGDPLSPLRGQLPRRGAFSH